MDCEGKYFKQSPISAIPTLRIHGTTAAVVTNESLDVVDLCRRRDVEIVARVGISNFRCLATSPHSSRTTPPTTPSTICPTYGSPLPEDGYDDFQYIHITGRRRSYINLQQTTQLKDIHGKAPTGCTGFRKIDIVMTCLNR
ncbi:hypothetical protein M409DRAFT_53707 [Zasmidium cellare ATCC 36951]|uniref:Uncharacterized protein n=1 Tax=Zasmidium cellare ATCC 36951 TaxID=1080233 RepID=A0A6A6CM94_ZASCE|nr:uncharacterized protein M409DRAFT_53707 [Zasmidium cellare ATCC 36951]KAF2167733.1 hypothetical protein M409DRAFT_53707 [Zasmidium cellare ATCC 36951]